MLGVLPGAILQVAVIDELEVGLRLKPSAELGRDEGVDLFGAFGGDLGRVDVDLVLVCGVAV